MSKIFTCNECGQRLNVNDAMLGKKVRCPKCKKIFVAASPSEPPTFAETVTAPPEPASTVQDVPDPGRESTRTPESPSEENLFVEQNDAEVPRTGRRRRDDDDNDAPHETEAPVKKRPARGSAEKNPEGKTRVVSQMGLRLFVLVTALVGAAAAGSLGYRWEKDYSEHQLEISIAKSFGQGDELKTFRLAYICLFAAAGAGVVGGLTTFFRFGIIGGLLLLAGGIAPIVFNVKTAMFTAALLVAGMLSFLVWSRRKSIVPIKYDPDGRPRKESGSALAAIAGVLGLIIVVGYGVFIGYVIYSAEEKANQRGPRGSRPYSADGPRRPDGPPTPYNLEPTKQVPFATVEKEVEAAGAGVKLVKLDLAPAGLEMTIDAPEGTLFKKTYSGLEIIKDDHFAIELIVGRRHFSTLPSNLSNREIIVNDPSLVFWNQSYDKSSNFMVAKELGHQDFSIQNNRNPGNKSVNHSRDDCLLMIKCARTIARKQPAPTSRDAALATFVEQVPEEESKKPVPGHIRLNKQATDVTLKLLGDDPKIQSLDLSNTVVSADALAHLKGLPNLERLNLAGMPLSKSTFVTHLAGIPKLKELNLANTSVDGENLKALASLSNLETLNLGNNYGLSDANLAQLSALKKLKKLEMDSNSMDDTKLVNLKDVTSLQELNLGSNRLLGPGLAQLNNMTNLKRLTLRAGYSDDKINDAGMTGIKGLTSLEELDLQGCNLNGDGLANLKGMKNLKSLNLGETKVTDAGLAHLAGMTKLEILDLKDCPVTDAGMAHLKGLKGLKKLSLGTTKVTNTGLRQFKDFDELEIFGQYGRKLNDTRPLKKVEPPVSLDKLKPADPAGMIAKFRGKPEKNDDGDIVELRFEVSDMKDLDLADLRELKKLRVLILGNSNGVTDAGLVYLTGLKELEELSIENTKFQGDGFPFIANLTKLRKLDTPTLKYSPKQLAALRPLVNLEDFRCDLSGDIEAKLEALSGLVKLRNVYLPFGDPLNDGALAHLGKLVGLESLQISGSDEWRLTDPGLAHLKNLKKLRYLWIGFSSVTGEGLVHLKDMEALENLTLSGTKISDASLEQLKGLKNLTILEINKTPITGTGFEHLKGLTKLTTLVAEETPISEAGMKQICSLPSLLILNLDKSGVSDAGLEQLKGNRTLKGLALRETKITGVGFAAVGNLPELDYLALDRSQFGDEGLKGIAGMKKLEKVELEGTRVTGAGLPHLNSLVMLEALNFSGTQVTGAGMKELKALENVTSVFLRKSKVTDAGLEYLKNFPKLNFLNLEDSGIGDAGLAHLKPLTMLGFINANGTSITDAGLKHLAANKSLTTLYAQRTKVTQKGADELKGALPKLDVTIGK